MISDIFVSRIQLQIAITTFCEESKLSENFSRFYICQTKVSGIRRMTEHCAIFLIKMHGIFPERLRIFKPTSSMMYSNNSRFYRFFRNSNRLKTPFENAKNVRKSIVFCSMKVPENCTFPNLFRIFERSSQPI